MKLTFAIYRGGCSGTGCGNDHHLRASGAVPDRTTEFGGVQAAIENYFSPDLKICR